MSIKRLFELTLINAFAVKVRRKFSHSILKITNQLQTKNNIDYIIRK